MVRSFFVGFKFVVYSRGMEGVTVVVVSNFRIGIKFYNMWSKGF